MRRSMFAAVAAATATLLVAGCDGEEAVPGPDLGEPDDSTVIEPTEPPEDLQGG